MARRVKRTWNKRKLLQEYRSLRFTAKVLLEMFEEEEPDVQTIHEHMTWIGKHATHISKQFTPAKLKSMLSGGQVEQKDAA